MLSLAQKERSLEREREKRGDSHCKNSALTAFLRLSFFWHGTRKCYENVDPLGKTERKM